MHTEDVVAILQEDKSIILNCTLRKDSNEEISNKDIRYQKKIRGIYKDIAIFSLLGGSPPIVVKEMQPLYNNGTELIAPNTSLASVMIIKDPVCTDVGAYRCMIIYFSDASEKRRISDSVVEFNGKYFSNFLNKNKISIILISLYMSQLHKDKIKKFFLKKCA